MPGNNIVEEQKPEEMIDWVEDGVRNLGIQEWQMERLTPRLIEQINSTAIAVMVNGGIDAAVKRVVNLFK